MVATHAHRPQEIKVSNTRLFTNIKLRLRFCRDPLGDFTIDSDEVIAFSEKDDRGRFECSADFHCV